MSSFGRCQDAVWDILDAHEPGLADLGIVDELVDAVYSIAFEQGQNQGRSSVQAELDSYRGEAWEIITGAARQLHAVALLIPGQKLRVPTLLTAPPTGTGVIRSEGGTRGYD